MRHPEVEAAILGKKRGQRFDGRRDDDARRAEKDHHRGYEYEPDRNITVLVDEDGIRIRENVQGDEECKNDEGTL
jgi:hypothetical protein